MQNTEYDWQYRSEPSEKACRSLENGCFWPRGKMLGGTHALNAMIYFRGHPFDFDEWHRLGNPSWDWSNVIEYFRRSERNENASFFAGDKLKFHGNQGPLSIGHYDGENPLRRVFVEAASEFGYKFVDDINADTFLGYANAQGTLKNGERHTTAQAFLSTAKDRPNLHVIKMSHVTKIHLDDNNKATAVDFVYKNDKKLLVKTKKEIILSAGSIGSSQILMLSGIGPANHLKNININVRKNLPVGRNLQDHLIVPVIFEFNKSPAKPETMNELLDSIYMYAIHRTGPLAGIGLIDLIGLVSTVNDAKIADIEVQHFHYRRQSSQMANVLKTIGYKAHVVDAITKANQNADIVIVYVELLRPESRGKIELKSSNYADKPKIHANYLIDDRDVATLLRGVKWQAKFRKTTTFKANEGELVRVPLDDCDRHKYLSDDYWKCYISHMSTTVYHPTGTCRMGPIDDERTVVDSKLRVKGVDGLRVVDASIMPNIVSANTNAVTIMIGEKGADFIKTHWMNDRDEL